LKNKEKYWHTVSSYYHILL